MMRAENRLKEFKAEAADFHFAYLIPALENNVWGKGRAMEEKRNIKKFCGFTPQMGKFDHAYWMDKFLEFINPSWLQLPGIVSLSEFLPISTSLVNFLAFGINNDAG